MSAKSNLSLLILILSVSSLFAGLAFAKQDPELKQCSHQCRVQQQFDDKQKEQCVRKCEDYHRQKKERETELDPGSGRALRECQSRCDGLRREERQLCNLRCQQRWSGEHEKQWEKEEKKQRETEEEEQGQQTEQHNPYVFQEQHFSTATKTEKGRVDILTKFTHNSDILRAIENYRLAILVANPKSFVVPNHFDANAIFVVTQGKGTITMIREGKRQSFNIETGDIIRVRAGTPLYLINRDDNEKLFIVKLLEPVNLPGHYEVFYGAGGAKESFYETFTTEIIEAALKTSRDKLESLFEKQGEGPFLEASKEQIEALSSDDGEGSKHGGSGRWPFGGGHTKGSFNLFRQRRPSQSNKYGQLFEVDANEFKHLEDFDLRVSYANISKGSMTAPFYNSKAIKIAIVVKGEGYFEMVSPQQSQSHDDSGEEKRRGSSYQKISSRLRPDTVFVVPAGHPFVTVASRNENLEVLCFEVNNENNVRYLLAGEGNIVQQFEKEAKELAFKSKEEEVDRIFGNQDEEFFFPGPRQHRSRDIE